MSIAAAVLMCREIMIHVVMCSGIWPDSMCASSHAAWRRTCVPSCRCPAFRAARPLMDDVEHCGLPASRFEARADSDQFSPQTLPLQVHNTTRVCMTGAELTNRFRKAARWNPHPWAVPSAQEGPKQLTGMSGFGAAPSPVAAAAAGAGAVGTKRHHLLKYELNAAIVEAARDHFGGVSPEEAGEAVWELQ